MENKQLSLFDTFNETSYQIQNDLFPENESYEVEFKSAQGGFPRDFWKTYSAFANTEGGIIVLGIKEYKEQFLVEGLTNEQIIKYQKDFWNGVNNTTTISCNVLKNSDVKEYILDSKKVLVFNIPTAERKNKPIHLTTNPFKNTYKRNYEGDYCCRDEEVRRMLADADFSFSPDSRILEGYSMEDIDSTSLAQYRQVFSTVKPSHPWLAYDDKEFLEQLGGFRKDRKTRKEGLTVAGILMFGKYQAIVDVECCPKFFPDYRETPAENEEIRWTDRIYPDGTWEANLFQFYKLVYPKLSSRLPKPFQLLNGQRRDHTPAHTALREAFVNALIHTDYSAPGSIIIESSTEAFTFTNPGTLLVTIAQFYKGGISQCRNTKLQQMFLMIGSAEKAGSGVSKIISGWSAAHWRRPYLTLESDCVVLQMPMFSILPENTLEDLKALYGDSVETLGKDELTVLAICHIEGDTNNNRLQYVVDRHRTDITKLLQELCKRRYLKSENKSRWTTYRLNEDSFNMDSSVSMDSSNMDSSANMDSSISMESCDINSNRLDSSNKDNFNMDSSNMDSSVNMDSSNMDSSDSMDSSIDNNSENTRYKYEEIADIIMDYCNVEYKSALEISKKIKKSEKYLKNIILPKMIGEGKLVRLYPENHPNQTYIAKR